MSDSYTKVTKPTGTGYTPVNGPGKISFDDSLVNFDSDVVAFDGGDGFDYSGIAKPTGTPYVKIPKPTS